MKIVKSLPPNWKDIEKTFPKAKEEQAVFCYGENLHNPFGAEITEDLKIHEAVHSRQQGDNPKDWWAKYINDPKFRIKEEAEAYSAQIFYLKNTKVERQDERGNKVMVYIPTRVIDWYLDKTAETLSGPLYGEVIDYHKARTLIRKNMENFATT